MSSFELSGGSTALAQEAKKENPYYGTTIVNLELHGEGVLSSRDQVRKALEDHFREKGIEIASLEMTGSPKGITESASLRIAAVGISPEEVEEVAKSLPGIDDVSSSTVDRVIDMIGGKVYFTDNEKALTKEEAEAHLEAREESEEA